MATVDIRKKYLDLEKRLKEHNPSESFQDIVSEQLGLLSELQKVIASKNLPIKGLEELGEVTSRISALFADKVKEQSAEPKKLEKKGKNEKAN